MSSVSVSCEAGGEAASYSLHVLSAGEEPFYVRRQWAELKDLAVEVRQRQAPGCRLQPRACRMYTYCDPACDPALQPAAD